MPVRRTSEVSRLHHNTADVLKRIDGLTGRPTAPQVVIQLVAERLKLAPVVDDGNDDVPALVSQRVEGVAPHDEPSRAVVLVRNLTHTRSMTPQREGCIPFGPTDGGTVADEDPPWQQDRQCADDAEGGRPARRPETNRRVVQESSDSVGTLGVWHPMLRSTPQ